MIEIEEFLTGARSVAQPERVLATVLFTDIVGSTERLSELGDRRWRDLLESHYRITRSELDRFRGREIKTTGDGLLASFDGPARAIRCALAVRDAVRPLGIEVRAGLHTGEVEVMTDDLGGIAVHVGARVAALAGPGEVLVSSTVKDLVAGAGLAFEVEASTCSGASRISGACSGFCPDRRAHLRAAVDPLQHDLDHPGDPLRELVHRHQLLDGPPASRPQPRPVAPGGPAGRRCARRSASGSFGGT